MYTTKDLQQEIIRLKRENGVCILAHAYQTQDILEVADFVGDSFGLSQQAAAASQKNILMCGVRFMAETAKILSPEKKVILSHPLAGCPMAEQLSVEELRALKAKYPGAAVVAYINTTAALKAECDVCVTSASALHIVRSLKQEEVLFIPDCNLGAWIKEQVPEKTFHLIQGGCPVHMHIKEADVCTAKATYPNAKLLIHPECLAEVTRHADYAGSTTGILAYVEKSEAKQFIIGTDSSIVQHLQFTYPDKEFFPLSGSCICRDMRLTTLVDVYRCVSGIGGEEILLPDAVRMAAKRSIDAMLDLGGK